MSSLPAEVKLALWSPGWYNLDQSVAVSEEDDFVVHARVPDLLPAGLSWQDVAPDLVFDNPIMEPLESSSRRLLVLSIRYPELGLVAIRTERFGVYEFIAADGKVYEVEAEEGQGSATTLPYRSAPGL